MVRQTQKGFPLQSMDHFGRQSVSHCSADASHTSDDHGAADDDHDNYDYKYLQLIPLTIIMLLVMIIIIWIPSYSFQNLQFNQFDF